MAVKDYTGFRFGTFVVIGRSDRPRHYYCRCECGVDKNVRADHLHDGLVMSCGCKKKELLSIAVTVHGHKTGAGETPTYSSWQSMLRRCLTPSTKGFKYWGGSGVTVCERWMDFSNFLADMGERPIGTTIDRHPNNNGNYEPGNCRWANWVEQAENKRTTITLAYMGKELRLKEWALILGVKRKTLWSRVKKGWPVEKILRSGNAKAWAAPQAKP